VSRKVSLVGPTRFRFLNEEHEIRSAGDWNNAGWPKLWLYNLHYFDDLNAEGCDSRQRSHLALLRRWVSENPPGRGVGWDPYPCSLRIVNWIKWALRGNPLPAEALHSLAVQSRWLLRRLEWHLLGNHLFANAKALVFAGMFFAGKEAQRWRDKGLTLLAREIPEQILGDGGHFERSPMYHAIVLEDLLDLANLLRAYGQKTPPSWITQVSRMRRWLATMVHPDGDIGFFNDVALGIAPSRNQLEAYARNLGLPAATDWEQCFVHLQDSGYLRLARGPAVLLADAAPVGPDYLPGHAHADTLSFELSLDGDRVLVNSGTSVYSAGPERDRQRSTAAHNTVTVDGENSSEVWAGFRVARRARIIDVVAEDSSAAIVQAAHDGYRRLRGGPIHRRAWELDANKLVVVDKIQGSGSHQVEAAFHVHPSFVVEGRTRCTYDLVFGSKGKRVSLSIDGADDCVLQPSTYHPEFGLSRKNQRLSARYRGSLPVEIRTTLRW
jgi:uncharacterized heparinase superfamily protein